jgi:hypothetical protein
VISLGRRAVSFAFRVDYVPSSSPITHFSGQETSKRGIRVLEAQRASKQVLLRSEIALRRAMRYEEVHATATRSSKFSKSNLSDRQRLHGSVHRAIARLNPLHIRWVNARYRPPGGTRGEYRNAFVNQFYGLYSEDHLRGYKVDTRRGVKYLMHVGIAHHGNPFVKPSRAALGVTGDQWRKSFLPHWNRLTDMLAEIDSAALYELGFRVSELDDAQTAGFS